MSRKRKFRLAAITSHPIQYQAPLFRKLAAQPKIELTVFFCSDHGLREAFDRELGRTFKWDIPLVEGYKYRFLKNFSPRPSVSTIWGLVNPGIVLELFRRQYDAIFIHNHAKITSILAYMAAKLRRIPVLLRNESTLLYERPWWVRAIRRLISARIFRGAAACLAIGSLNAQFYREYGVPSERIFMVPYAVDNEFFCNCARIYGPKKEQILEELGIPPSWPVILFCGKLVRRKRPKDLLLAFERVRRTHNAALIFVGDGEERGMLEDYVQCNRVPNVHFVGFVNQFEISRYYIISDIFVLPSECEPWGLVINEAMVHGCAIIASNLVGAAADLVRGGENGFVYRAGDVDGLATCLERLLADPELRVAMGQRSRELISNWDLDADVEGFLRALESVTKNHQTRARQ